MAIKHGVPLYQTGILNDEQLRIAKALSLTTVDELAGLVLAEPDELGFFISPNDLPRIANEAIGMAANTVRDDNARAAEMAGTRGTGALSPSFGEARRVEELLLDDVDLRPGNPSDEPEAFLESCLGPIRNQGRRGTCVAHAVVAMLECLLHRRHGVFTDLSEQYLYWACKMNDRAPTESGTWQRVAVPLVVESGVCEEAVWPYHPHPVAGNEGQGPPQPDRRTCEASAARYRPSNGVFVKGSALDMIRTRLDAGRCLAISVPVFRNWRFATAERYGHLPLPLLGALPTGGHAMCVVGYGYSDEFTGGGYVIVRNSWGDTWAPDSPFAPGYGTLPFSYVSEYCWELTSFD
jgi:hypothetical protein